MFLDDICKDFGIRTYSYQEAPELIHGFGLDEAAKQSDGFALYFQNMPIVLFNADRPAIQIYFTVAHEIGHIVLGHVSFRDDFHRKHTDSAETEANAFAVNLLANTLRRCYEEKEAAV